jgi:AcrR family transcriptional regulator
MRHDRRLGEILEAGARVLAERGVHGATMRRVAREARTSLANLYHYVGGREDLLYRVHARVLEAAVASAQAALGARGARERLRALVTDHVRRVLARPVEAEVLRGPPGLLRGDRARRLDDLRRRYLALVRLAADAAGRRPAARPREGEIRAQLLLAMADRVALDAARSRTPPSPERLAAPVLRLFLA